jgi:hypothetical protein
MRFTTKEIEMARQLRQLGLPWEPQAGHYVYDETGFCQKGSPFQDGVYFILNYDYFISQAGGVDRFKQIMLWLPIWHDARELLRSLGVSDGEVAAALQTQHAIENQRELLSLFELIAARLTSDQVGDRNHPRQQGPAGKETRSHAHRETDLPRPA